MPLGGAVAALILAAALAPRIHGGADAARFSSLFATSAQVIGALLVALVVETRSLRPRDMATRRLLVGGTLSYVGVGAVAAVVALNPTLSTWAYHLLFALTMAGAAGALLGVLAIAYYVTDSDLRELREHATASSSGPSKVGTDSPPGGPHADDGTDRAGRLAG